MRGGGRTKGSAGGRRVRDRAWGECECAPNTLRGSARRNLAPPPLPGIGGDRRSSGRSRSGMHLVVFRVRSRGGWPGTPISLPGLGCTGCCQRRWGAPRPPIAAPLSILSCTPIPGPTLCTPCLSPSPPPRSRSSSPVGHPGGAGVPLCRDRGFRAAPQVLERLRTHWVLRGVNPCLPVRAKADGRIWGGGKLRHGRAVRGSEPGARAGVWRGLPEDHVSLCWHCLRCEAAVDITLSTRGLFSGQKSFPSCPPGLKQQGLQNRPGRAGWSLPSSPASSS